MTGFLVTMFAMYGINVLNQLRHLMQNDYPRYEETPAWVDVVTLVTNAGMLAWVVCLLETGLCGKL